MNKLTVPLLIFIVILLLVGLAYFALQNQKILKDISHEKSPSNSSTQETKSIQLSPSPAATPSPKQLTLTEVQEGIKTASNNTEHSTIATYLAKGKINFIIMSSSCCEPKTAEDAINSLSYVDEGIPFDFNQNSPIVKNLKTKNERLKNAYIGISQTKENLVAYTLNSKNEITQIEVSVSYKLYDF